MKRVFKSKGFTLVELIVCIAIIAVLSAIMIPLMTNWVGSAQEAACALQRAQVKEQLAAQYLYSGKTEYTEDEKAELGWVCPSCGKKYGVQQIYDSLFVVTCSEHSAGGYYGVGLNKPYFDASKCLTDSLDDMIKALNKNVSSVDSNCPNSNGFTRDMLAYLDKIGYKLNLSNIEYWAVRSTSSSKKVENCTLYWTQVPLTLENFDKYVLVMEYSVKNKTYKVDIIKTKKNTNVNDETKESATYTVLNITSEYMYTYPAFLVAKKSSSTALVEPTGDDAKDFDKVMTYFNQVKQEIVDKGYDKDPLGILTK